MLGCVMSRRDFPSLIMTALTTMYCVSGHRFFIGPNPLNEQHLRVLGLRVQFELKCVYS